MSDRREEIKKAMRFMGDAANAEEASESRIENRERKAKQSLIGKAGAMGAKLGFFKEKDGGTFEDADKAFDAVQNYDESRAEDERTKVKMLAAKIKSLREKSK